MFLRYHHASTAQEGALRGRAALRQADGNYLLSYSQAAILAEQHRWLALSNRQRWIEYRIGWRLWRDIEREARVAKKRHSNELLRPSKYAVYRLHSTQLDRATGQLTWPRALQAAEYNDLRQQLNSLFRYRVAYGSDESSIQNEIESCIARLRQDLRRSRGRLDGEQYFAAQRFLNGLLYESISKSQT
jgi:hypothetical protein